MGTEGWRTGVGFVCGLEMPGFASVCEELIVVT